MNIYVFNKIQLVYVVEINVKKLEILIGSLKITKMNKKEEIFTIGDKTTFGIITCFRLLDNEIMVDFDNNNSILLKSKQLQKAKQPLFTTEDGVDIFEGDSYIALLSNYDLTQEKAGFNHDNIYCHCLKFSTKEKAEEYILMNKPCLSVNEVIDYFNNWSTRLTKKDWSETLKKRAQKLNNKN